MNPSSASKEPAVPEILFEKLRQVARDQEVAYYSAIARLVGIDTSNEYFGSLVGRLLDRVNHHEFANGRPLFSAVVVAKETSRPGYGYYGCARGLKHYASKDDDALWLEELLNVYAYWSRH